VLDDPAAPGAFVRGQIRAGRCRVRASLAVVGGRARGGDVVRAQGSAFATRRGLTIKRARLGRPSGVSVGRALRARASTTIDSLFGVNAPMARALLVADTRGIDPTIRDRFAESGIVHMLSISGLHVGIIALAVQLVFQAIRLPRAAASMGTVTVTAIYVLIIGAPAPAVRSGVMLGVALVSRMAQRPTSPWAALALGAAVPLAEPRMATDLGYQLSVVGIAGLIASAALARRWIAPHLDGWRAAVARVLLASTVASMATAPLVAWSFGRVSIIAPLTNLAAAPIVGVLQPALFLVLVLAPLSGLASFLADAVHPLFSAFSTVAFIGAAVPHASLTVAPTLTGAMLAAVATAALLWACLAHFPSRPLVVAFAAAAIAAWIPLAPSRAREVELHMIDVGQGDAIALRTPRGRWVLFDAGRAWRGGDAGRATVVPYLRRRGGELAAFVLSHPHADHVGGVESVLRALRPPSYWDGAYIGGSEPYRESLAAALAGGVRWRRVGVGESTAVDGVRLRMLAPDSAWMSTLDDPNDASVVVMIEYGQIRFLLMGDAERDEEHWLLANAPLSLRADVLKVGHHGSITSSTGAFLAAVRPRAALVSVGAGNGYGHPSPRVMSALADMGAEVLRSDQLGSVVVRTDGTRIVIHADGDTWPLSTP
jgi:competence protein ComEC